MICRNLLVNGWSFVNIYHASYQEKAEQLLNQLENCSNNNHNNSLTKPDNFPWKVIAPFLLIGLLLLMLVVVRKRGVRQKKKT